MFILWHTLLALSNASAVSCYLISYFYTFRLKGLRLLHFLIFPWFLSSLML